jgi:hypothetical protein
VAKKKSGENVVFAPITEQYPLGEEKVIVVFKAHHRSYFSGDRAGFPAAEAEELVRRGIATKFVSQEALVSQATEYVVSRGYSSEAAEKIVAEYGAAHILASRDGEGDVEEVDDDPVHPFDAKIVEFLKARGDAIETVDAAAEFVQGLDETKRGELFAAFAEWLKAQPKEPAVPAAVIPEGEDKK